MYLTCLETTQEKCHATIAKTNVEFTNILQDTNGFNELAKVANLFPLKA